MRNKLIVFNLKARLFRFSTRLPLVRSKSFHKLAIKELELYQEIAKLTQRLDLEVLPLRNEIEELKSEKSRLLQFIHEFEAIRGSFLENIIHIHYKSNYMSDLHMLSQKYGSDKGGDPNSPKVYSHRTHNYMDYYERIFAIKRFNVMNVLECGIGTNNLSIQSNMGSGGIPGASLRIWRDYFENSEVYGLDIDRSILFTEDRIKTFEVDQTCTESIEFFLNCNPNKNFEIIIDDGLHNFQANITLFTNLFPRLTREGIYIIEDVLASTISKYTNFFENLPVLVEVVNLEAKDLEIGDNNLIVIRNP